MIEYQFILTARRSDGTHRTHAGVITPRPETPCSSNCSDSWRARTA